MSRLEARGIAKRYRTREVVKDLSISIDSGEVVGLLGPNGAGKTTLCDLVSGKTRPTTGKVYFEGDDITNELEANIALRGIGRKFQTPRVYDSLTTFENMELALPGSRKVRRFFGRTAGARENENILPVSYTHLTLPTNREV